MALSTAKTMMPTRGPTISELGTGSFSPCAGGHSACHAAGFHILHRGAVLGAAPEAVEGRINPTVAVGGLGHFLGLVSLHHDFAIVGEAR